MTVKRASGPTPAGGSTATMKTGEVLAMTSLWTSGVVNSSENHERRPRGETPPKGAVSGST